MVLDKIKKNYEEGKRKNAEVVESAKNHDPEKIKKMDETIKINKINEEKIQQETTLNTVINESRIVDENELNKPEIKALITKGATVTYLGEEKVYGQGVRILTTLIGLIIGTVILPFIGSLIGAGIGYWISNDKRKQYHIQLKKE